jgi:hypothetical protein
VSEAAYEVGGVLGKYPSPLGKYSLKWKWIYEKSKNKKGANLICTFFIF